MSFFFIILAVFIGAIFVIVGVIFASVIGRIIGQWSYNNSQPVLTVLAHVISKRTNTSGSMMNSASGSVFSGGMMNSSSGSVSTSYYVTFELDTHQRLEFGVRGGEYGLLIEGDRGTLTYQGTRYRGFERHD